MDEVPVWAATATEKSKTTLTKKFLIICDCILKCMVQTFQQEI